MYRFFLANMIMLGFCGVALANPTRPYPLSASAPANGAANDGDIRFMLIKLHQNIQMLQIEVQILSSSEGQSPADPHYIFSAGPSTSTDPAGG